MKETTVPVKQEQQVPDTREETRTVLPPVDIFEINDVLAVVADLPGVEKDGVELRIEDDVLTIKGTPKAAVAGEALYSEFELAPYFRQFQLGEQVDRDKIQAEMKHGVLTIRLPKVEQAKPKRIEVKVG